MCGMLKILLFLNLLYLTNGEADEVLILTSDWTTGGTTRGAMGAVGNRGAVQLQQANGDINVKIREQPTEPQGNTTEGDGLAQSEDGSQTTGTTAISSTRMKTKIGQKKLKTIPTKSNLGEISTTIKTVLESSDSVTEIANESKKTTKPKISVKINIKVNGTKGVTTKKEIDVTTKKENIQVTKKIATSKVVQGTVSGNRPSTLNPYDLANDLVKVMDSFPNAQATTEVIGRSVEYKDIVLLKITDANKMKVLREDEAEVVTEKVEQNQEDGKKIIFIVHGLSTFDLWKVPCLHAEIPFTKLISYYLSHLKNFDIFFVPVANPDGFAKKDNLWNKNVSPQMDCGGVALDRNFDVAWSTSLNVSSCSQMYPGPAPFSEAESTAIKDVFLQYGKRMAAYIHIHATNNNFDYRGNTILFPKGHTDAESNEDKYIDMKGEIDEAMKKAKFDIASVNMETLYSWYGAVAGTSVDYASEVIGVPFAMEFLMQPYATKMKGVKKDLNHASLTQIWRRVINTVFNFVHKANNSDEIE